MVPQWERTRLSKLCDHIPSQPSVRLKQGKYGYSCRCSSLVVREYVGKGTGKLVVVSEGRGITISDVLVE